MKPTTNDLLSRLSAALKGKEDVVPDGFKTRSQWQEEWECSTCQAKKLLKAGIKSGLIESRKYRIMQGQSLYPTPHYGPVTQECRPAKKPSARRG